MAYIIQEEGTRDGTSFYHIGDGYQYHFHSDTPTAIYFICRKSSCRGRALLRYNTAFEHTQAHNHSPDLLYPQVMAARRNIINQARSATYVSFSQILSTERRRIANRMVRSELTLRRLRPAMQRARSEVYPNLPDDLQGLTDILQDPIWTSLVNTLDGEDSIYLGSTWAIDGSHSIIFISRRCLEIMRSVDILFADGTFFVKPSVQGCYQVFTIVTVVGHTVLPLCWILMDSKSESAYVSVLTFLRTHLGHWRFTTVVCDYECAILNAFLIVFGIIAQGCLFHSATAMSRWARNTIGIPIISYYEPVRNVIRLCCSIPLLPEHLLQRGLDAVGTEALNFNDPPIYDFVHPFLTYIQGEWLNHPSRGRSISVCQSPHRTNNASESNNGRMKRKFGIHHPNVYHFTGEISNFEDDTIDDYTSLCRGIIPTRHRAVSSISNDAHIARITAQLLEQPDPTDQDILNFLAAAAFSVDGIVQEGLQFFYNTGFQQQL